MTSIENDSPPQRWTCDSCGDVIDEVGLGLLTWRDDVARGESRSWDFRIVHKNIAGRRCDPGANGAEEFSSSEELSTMLGPGGQSYLLSFVSAGPMNQNRSYVDVADMDNFVDVFRRLQTPWYEQARARFRDSAIKAEFNLENGFEYRPAIMRQIAEYTV